MSDETWLEAGDLSGVIGEAMRVELLDALKACRSAWLSEANEGDGIAEEHAGVLETVNSVIAKAEGTTTKEKK